MAQEECPQTRKRESTNRIHLVTTFNRYFTFIAEIVIRNWSFLQSKERLAGIFNKPHLQAYRRPKRLQDRAVSTKFKISDNTPVPRGCETCTKPKCSWCKQINKIITFEGRSNNKLFFKYSIEQTLSPHGLSTSLSVTSATYSTQERVKQCSTSSTQPEKSNQKGN